MMARGLVFWTFGISAAFTLLMDYVVMSQTLSSQDITIYNILTRLFMFVFFIYNALLSVLWPVVAELYVRKEWRQATTILQKNIGVGVGFMAICTVLFILSKTLIMRVIAPSSQLVLPVTTIFLFGLYFIIRVWSDTYSMALQSQNAMKVFLYYVPLQAIVSGVGMYVFSQHFGVNGILYGLITSFILTASWILPYTYYKR
jgi:O-antigen/teichoic acid export membrane protein